MAFILTKNGLIWCVLVKMFSPPRVIPGAYPHVIPGLAGNLAFHPRKALSTSYYQLSTNCYLFPIENENSLFFHGL